MHVYLSLSDSRKNTRVYILLCIQKQVYGLDGAVSQKAKAVREIKGDTQPKSTNYNDVSITLIHTHTHVN